MTDRLTDLDEQLLQDSRGLDALLDQDRRQGFRNYDYVRTTDDTIVLLHGDKQDSGQLRGLPVYLPDEDGERTIDGRSYRKAPLDETALDGPYTADPLERGVVRFPVEIVEDHVSPYHDRPATTDRLDDQQYSAYESVATIIEDNGGDHMLIGSQYLGAETQESDIDIVALLEQNTLHEIEQDLIDDDAIAVETDSEDHTVELTRRRAGSAPSYTADVYQNSRDRPKPTIDGTSVDILAMQEHPFTEYYLPESGGTRLNDLDATITDTKHGHCVPAVYTIETNGTDDRGNRFDGEYDLVSFLPVYQDSLEDGDQVRIRGRLYDDQETIYLSDRERKTSYVTARSGLFSRGDPVPDRLSISHSVETKKP